MSVEIEPDITLFENEDGSWTARDTNRGLTTQGETRDEALSALDDVIEAVEGDGGRPPTDEELQEAGINPVDNSSSGELPDVLK